jgi:hypothetical protein
MCFDTAKGIHDGGYNFFLLNIYRLTRTQAGVTLDIGLLPLKVGRLLGTIGKWPN